MVEIVDQAPGQPGVGPQLLLVEPQAHQAAQFQAVGHMGLPTAHEVENRHAGFQQAALQRRDDGLSPNIHMAHQAGLGVKAGVVLFILPPEGVISEKVRGLPVAAGLDPRAGAQDVEPIPAFPGLFTTCGFDFPNHDFQGQGFAGQGMVKVGGENAVVNAGAAEGGDVAGVPQQEAFGIKAPPAGRTGPGCEACQGQGVLPVPKVRREVFLRRQGQSQSGAGFGGFQMPGRRGWTQIPIPPGVEGHKQFFRVDCVPAIPDETPDRVHRGARV
jgi:hypothetical protein